MAWQRGATGCLSFPHAGIRAIPLPVFPAGLLRSEPAAVRFKAAIAPRSGRNPPISARLARVPRKASEELAPLVRKPTSLAWQAQDPEASSFRRFLLTAPAGKTGKGRNT
ncbi:MULTISPECIES: hypothetical protein [Mesorhizobium]|uniref:hypothetical protein n=1 Tax=Mesorhizobium TaxID=68287 RepID=UPI0010A97745|nr:MULTISPECIES: hypothetical protein [Mesorhizobium]